VDKKTGPLHVGPVRRKKIKGGDYSFLAKDPTPSQEGHFLGLQRPSFSNPHFSHFQTAITYSFQTSSQIYDQDGYDFIQKRFPVKKKI
jgi:hypothetical protein